MAPSCGPKTERAEQDEDAAGDEDQPLGDKPRKQRLRPDTTRHGQEAGAHPSGVGALGGKDRAVGRELRRCAAMIAWPWSALSVQTITPLQADCSRPIVWALVRV